MHVDRGEALTGKSPVEFERLFGTLISHVDFIDSTALVVEGRSAGGEPAWRLLVHGSARFTFSHGSQDRPWLVEANFDPGGTVRKNDRAMISAVCGAVVASFHADEEGLFIGSDDGRAIQVPHELNEDGIILELLADEAEPRRIVLTSEELDG